MQIFLEVSKQVSEQSILHLITFLPCKSCQIIIYNNKQLYCAFVDYSKAFDFVNRSYLWQKVLESNINGKILNVIRNMYKDAKSHVSLKNVLSDSFPCQVGVRQGENLSPLLFAIFLNDFKAFLSRDYKGLTCVSESIMNELNVLESFKNIAKR